MPPDLDQLRKQTRRAVTLFVQMVLDHPANRDWLSHPSPRLAHDLWRDGLITAYRLLFLLKRESCSGAADHGREEPSAATLVALAQAALHDGEPTASGLEARLRRLFQQVAGGAWTNEVTTTLSQFTWGDAAVAHLLDQLLWVPTKGRRSGRQRQRIDLTALAIEDLGHIYEGLLELEPGIATEPMCRLRRQKLEVVVPLPEGHKYRDPPAARPALKVQWIEEIRSRQFYLRAGLGRKAAGAYYTPHTFVRFLVQQTLRPQVDQCSPAADPQPQEILKLKVLDPAMGSGHFLVEACRFLGEKLYEACRLCAQQAAAAQQPEEAQRWRDRIGRLPHADVLLTCVDGGFNDDNTPGALQPRALALCRRLVATHCLYGIDKNPLAVELARLALWLVADVPGLPLLALNHHLVPGDALTGPFCEQLFTRPSRPKQPPDEYTDPTMQSAFRQTLTKVLQQARQAQSGSDEGDMDEALLPFRLVAAAWSGGVMLGPGRCDDAAYRELLQHIAAHGCWPDRIDCAPLRAMIARGLGVEEVPADWESLRQWMQSGICVPALAYELAFPEVFYPDGDMGLRQGFHAVLGNPPWEAVRPRRGEFFGSLDLEALAGYTKRERAAAEMRLLENPAIAQSHAHYIDEIEGLKRAYDGLYQYQKLMIDGSLAGRYLDQYRVFMERSALVVRQGGRVGLVVPAAFRANAGAVGIRHLYLLENCLNCCYTFRNTRQLFEISAGMQFCLVVATFGRGQTRAVEVAFDLEDDRWLGADQRQPAALNYPLELIQATGGAYLTIVNLPGEAEVRLMLHLAGCSQPLGESRWFANIQFQTNPAALNATTDSWRLEETRRVCQGDPRAPEHAAALLAGGFVPLHEKGTIARYHARERERPRYLVNLRRCADRPDLAKQLRFYRLMGRSAIHASEPEKAVFALIPPGGLVSNSAMVEAAPQQRPNAAALVALAILNSHTFNYLAAQQVVLNLNLFILRNLLVPAHLPAATCLAHGALRLSANDAAYAPLWEEQLEGLWREPGKPALCWPAVAGESERAIVRAALDAVVAAAYGLSRVQYACILAAVDHSAWPNSPAQCLACYDALQQLGLAAFIKQYDPYHDVPLIDTLPRPSFDGPPAMQPPAGVRGAS